jgi:tetratricopeptide (TPR) repeat protein
VPVSAEEFARRKRRVWIKWLIPAVLLVLVAVLVYRKSTTSLDAQKALDDGQVMLKATRYTDAIQSFNRALSLNSNLADAYLARGRANAALSRLDAAIQDFTKVIQLRPDSSGAYMERANASFTKMDYPAVIADCGEALARDPKLFYAYNLRGMSYRETGNPAKALEDFDRLVQLSPGLDAYFQRAATYQTMGEHKMAIADLDRVIEIFPSSPMGYLARAKSREAMGDVTGARGDREEGRILEERSPGQ